MADQKQGIISVAQEEIDVQKSIVAEISTHMAVLRVQMNRLRKEIDRLAELRAELEAEYRGGRHGS